MGADLSGPLKRLLRRAYALSVAACIAAVAVLWRIRRGHAPAYDPTAVRRILVMRFGLLGDGVLTTPALRLLRESFRHAEIHLLATPGQAELLRPLPFVDDVILWTAGDLLEPRQARRGAAWTSAASSLRRLRRARYDLAISLYGRLGSAVALLSGAPSRFGYAGEAFRGTLTHALPGRRYDRDWHEAAYNVALVREASARPGRVASTEDAGPLALVVDDGARRTLAAVIAHESTAQGIAVSGPLAVLHPGATNGAAKRWPPAYWATLASRFGQEGATVVLAGSPDDRQLGRAIAGACTPRPLDLVGRTTLHELLALLERAAVFVSGDSGPVHFAVALGRPVVAIYGPTDPVVYGPYQARKGAVVRHALPCSPCYRLDRVADCPLGHTLCQRLIPPDDVLAAIRSVQER
jgi:lipopolysaccharide heptosyltransferase II